jgi:hypothetical protein
MKYHFFSDAGHGWLKVKIEELENLKIQNKISTCSYMRNNCVYLEEDGDLSLFCDEKGIIPADFDKNIIQHTSNHSSIRSYEPYSYDIFKARKEFLTKYENDEIFRAFVIRTIIHKAHARGYEVEKLVKIPFEKLSRNFQKWALHLSPNIYDEILGVLNYSKVIYQSAQKIGNTKALDSKLEEIELEIQWVMIQKWNNPQRICAICKKKNLSSPKEREKNCCIVCGLVTYLENSS